MTHLELLEKCGVVSDLDLLEILPYRYEDLSPLADEYFLRDGQRIRACYSISDVKTNRAHGIIRFKGLNSVNGIEHQFLVYNQMFYLNRIANGRTIFVVGKYSNKFKAVIVTAIYELSSRYVQTEIKPVYKLPSGVSQSYFANAIDSVLNGHLFNYVKDVVPKEFISKYKLLNRTKAFKYVHQPNNKKELDEGLRNFKYEESLAYCLKIYATKMIRFIYKKGSHLSIDRSKMNALVSSFGFELTKDQIKSTKEIMDDMDSDEVMFRMLQGDVGTGKTAVALMCLYANTLRGGQGVLFAPTTSLAMQHYSNALKLFDKFDVKVGLLINGIKPSERKKILENLACGDIDILITTQAGIGKNVEYKKLTLSVIDEQQQFGVDQRMQMVAKGDSVDTLMMSATPIPRTMSRIVYGDLDVSELKEFPKGVNRHVETKVIDSMSPMIDKAIERALEIKRQIFVIVPRIDSNDEDDSSLRISASEVYEEYSKKYGTDKVQLLHGRMKKEDQERILYSFRSGDKPILISTSIVEVGVDVQKACLMIIYSANYFGLSGLHQLRGRIGRDGSNALTLLVYDGDDKQAIEKLEFLATHNDGYEISQYDLKMRGSGNLAGTDQSGIKTSVLSFSDDKIIMECALKDAQTILDNSSTNEGFDQYKKKIINDERLDKILA